MIVFLYKIINILISIKEKNMILLFGGEKGGAGKTTLATNIVSMRIKEERDTFINRYR